MTIISSMTGAAAARTWIGRGPHQPKNNRLRKCVLRILFDDTKLAKSAVDLCHAFPRSNIRLIA
jgi:hypothetical protein